jgi:hypothetical protein
MCRQEKNSSLKLVQTSFLCINVGRYKKEKVIEQEKSKRGRKREGGKERRREDEKRK